MISYKMRNLGLLSFPAPQVPKMVLLLLLFLNSSCVLLFFWKQQILAVTYRCLTPCVWEDHRSLCSAQAQGLQLEPLPMWFRSGTRVWGHGGAALLSTPPLSLSRTFG